MADESASALDAPVASPTWRSPAATSLDAQGEIPLLLKRIGRGAKGSRSLERDEAAARVVVAQSAALCAEMARSLGQARRREAELEREVECFIDEGQKLALRAVEMEEELEQALSSRRGLMEVELELRSQLAQAEEKVLALKKHNQSPVRGLEKKVGKG